MLFKKESGKFALFVKKLTIEIYHPYVINKIGKEYSEHDKPYDSAQGTRTEIGFFAPTTIFYTRPRDGWSWDRAFVLRFLGIGFGVSWKHFENPNLKESL